VVEEQLHIPLGVFGQLAAGGAGIFTPAPADRRGGDRRAARRFATAGRDDMRRSEAAVGHCVAEWQRRSGRTGGPGADPGAELDESDVERVVSRLEEISRAWQDLVPGRSLVFEWPRAATVDPAGSHRGRRPNRSTGRPRLR
jgi:hypothetical protein